MTGPEFLNNLADALVEELAPIDRLNKFTTNSDIVGAHAETRVRAFVRRCMRPVHVSTGAVIDEQLCSSPKDVPQIDTIFWWPMPSPAVFEQDDFALVPRSSCFGILEIKSSVYSRAGERMKKVLDRGAELVGDARIVRSDGTVAQDPWLGVFCIDQGASDPPSRVLIDAGRALVLLESDGKTWKTNHVAVLEFANFLVNVRTLAFGAVGFANINVALLKPAASAPHSTSGPGESSSY